MTELEKIERAKLYIDKLANGIDPLDDSVVPEGDRINQVRISRCFFFVSDVLRQVIENGGTKPAAGKRPPKLPLEVPFEKRQYFAYSKRPITASEIARRVNDLVDDEHMQKLTYSEIITWFIEIGMVEDVLTSSGKHIKRPTKLGEDNGISVEERTGRNGTYQVVVYNTAAQQFLVDNLDAVLVVGNWQAEMQGAPWRREHDDRLLDLYNKSVPLREIAIELKRSTSAVRSRLKKLGIADPQ